MNILKYSYPKTPTASLRILSESKEERFSGRKVAELRGCLSCCTAAKIFYNRGKDRSKILGARLSILKR